MSNAKFLILARFAFVFLKIASISEVSILLVSSVLPSFTCYHCTKFFIKIFSTVGPFQKFSIPSWIPKFSEPSTPFDLSPPTHQKVTRVIRRMKSSGSPCPLDILSIICLKRCPYLRSILTKVIRVVWESLQVSTEWERLALC